MHVDTQPGNSLSACCSLECWCDIISSSFPGCNLLTYLRVTNTRMSSPASNTNTPRCGRPPSSGILQTRMLFAHAVYSIRFGISGSGEQYGAAALHLPYGMHACMDCWGACGRGLPGQSLDAPPHYAHCSTADLCTVVTLVDSLYAVWRSTASGEPHPDVSLLPGPSCSLTRLESQEVAILLQNNAECSLTANACC